MATPGVDPNWPEPLGRRATDIFSRPLAIAVGALWEALNAALGYLPAGLGLAALYCTAVFVRARQRDMMDIEAEKSAVQVVSLSPMMFSESLQFSPSGILLTMLPIQSGG